MTLRHATLDELQQWMLTAITAPSAPAHPELERTILRSRQQSSAERLAVYRQAYVARLLDVLREQFPCTRFAVGDELFAQFATGYLREYPPASYTLARLADHWVNYLEATRPANWGEFLVELARLEQTIDGIFDAPGPEQLPPFVLPEDATAALCLSFVPGLQLLAFHYPVSTYYTAWKAGDQPAWPEPKEQFVALLRRDYIVRRHELSLLQFRLLSALQSGANLGAALLAATEADSVPITELTAQVRQWFAVWASERFFAAAH